MENYQWQGEKVKVRFGLTKVKTNKEKPLYWYNYEISLEETIMQGKCLISSIEVEASYGSKFIIANHFGIGVHKLLNGGYPNIGHFSFDDDAKFSEHKEFKKYNGQFELEEYEEHEANRRKWQRENYPIEFAKSERLVKLINKN
jgi:hypothetical protein